MLWNRGDYVRPIELVNEHLKVSMTLAVTRAG